jgi:DNA-binding MarR family transcriptional regulator
MSGRLAKELLQTKPFATPAEEAFLNVLRTAAVLEQAETEALKPKGLTPAQYNILRILRGAGQGGRSCQEIAERLITRDPDLTRLLDRLEMRSLASRERSRGDRRIVVTRISQPGLDLLAALDPVIRDLPRKALGHLGEKKLRALIDLLEEVRERP